MNSNKWMLGVLLTGFCLNAYASSFFDKLNEVGKKPGGNSTEQTDPDTKRSVTQTSHTDLSSASLNNVQTINDAQGWLDTLTVTRNNILMGQAIGKKGPFLNVNLHVAAITSASNGPVHCQLVILDETEPYRPGTPQNKLNSPSLQMKFDTYSRYAKGYFVKLINLRILSHMNQKFCLVSSVASPSTNPKTTATFDSKTHFIGKVYESIDRIQGQGSRYNFFYGPDNARYKDAISYTPINYSCISFRWSSAENAALAKKAFDRYIQKTSLIHFTQQGVELSGIRPLNKKGLCTFDSVKLI